MNLIALVIMIMLIVMIERVSECKGISKASMDEARRARASVNEMLKWKADLQEQMEELARRVNWREHRVEDKKGRMERTIINSDILRAIRLAEMLLDVVGLELVGEIKMQDRSTGTIYSAKKVRGEMKIETETAYDQQ